MNKRSKWELEFTPKEKELYAKLKEKRKQIQKETRECKKWADQNKEELLKRWNIDIPDENPVTLSDVEMEPELKNNPIIQMLLACESCGVSSPEIVKKLLNDSGKLEEITKVYEKNQYSDINKMRYTQMANMKKHKAKISLIKENKTAAVIFDLMAGHCAFYNYIQISQSQIAKLIGGSKKTISNALDYLKENGFVRVVAKESSRMPPVYQLNPTLVWMGKPKQQLIAINVFNKAIGKEILEKFNALDNQYKNVRMSYLSIPLENRTVTIPRIQNI